MASSPAGTDDAPTASERGARDEWPETELRLAEADETPASIDLAGELPYGALVAFDGSGPEAWIAVGRDCCLELPDTR